MDRRSHAQLVDKMLELIRIQKKQIPQKLSYPVVFLPQMIPMHEIIPRHEHEQKTKYDLKVGELLQQCPNFW